MYNPSPLPHSSSSTPELSKKEKKHRDMYERVDRLQRDFLDNYEKIFNQKLAQVSQEILDISASTHPEYDQQLKQLVCARDLEIAAGMDFRDYQLDCIDAMFDAERKATLDNFENERKGLKDKLIHSLESKKKNLLSSLSQFDFIPPSTSLQPRKSTATRYNSAAPETASATGTTRGYKRKRNNEKVPVLSLALKSYEADEDLGIIRRSAFHNGFGNKKYYKSRM